MRISTVQALEEFHTWPEEMRRDYHIRAHLNNVSVIELMRIDEVVYPEISVAHNKPKLVPKTKAND